MTLHYDTLVKENHELKQKIVLLTIQLEELQNFNNKNASDKALTGKLSRIKNFFTVYLEELIEQVQHTSKKVIKGKI